MVIGHCMRLRLVFLYGGLGGRAPSFPVFVTSTITGITPVSQSCVREHVLSNYLLHRHVSIVAVLTH